MTQILKDEIKNRINSAALECFSKTGFTGTSMKLIAKRAEISTGNIYHYYKNKNDLFYTLITDDIINEIKNVIFKKMKSFNNEDIGSSSINNELIKVLIKYRFHSIIILSGSKGTKYEKFISEMISFLQNLFIEYIAAKGTDKNKINDDLMILLKIIYKNLLMGISEILKKADNPIKLKNGLEALLNYHLYGILKI